MLPVSKVLYAICQVGDGSKSPYTYPNITASYVIKWIQGAKTYYDLTIDYIGVSSLLELSQVITVLLSHGHKLFFMMLIVLVRSGTSVIMMLLTSR